MLEVVHGVTPPDRRAVARRVAKITGGEEVESRSEGRSRRGRTGVEKQKLALAAERSKAEKQDEVKYFSAQMCGAGREFGGTKENKAHRMDFLERVRKQFPPLSVECAAEYEDFKGRLECRLSSYIGIQGRGYGQWFKEQMDGVLKRKKDGDLGAFEKWIRQTSLTYKTMLDGCTKV